MTFKASAEHPNQYFGFSLAEDASFLSGHDIRFDLANRKVGVHEINSVSYRENEDSSIYHVDFLNEPITVDAIVRQGFIDICVDGKRTLISRIRYGQNYLRFFSQFGAVTITYIRIQPLKV